jgi:hypothetical protein
MFKENPSDFHSQTLLKLLVVHILTYSGIYFNDAFACSDGAFDSRVFFYPMRAEGYEQGLFAQKPALCYL